MKKIRENFFKITLVKQLFIIIGMLFVFISFVVCPYVDTKLNNIVEQQVYKLLAFQQNQLMSMFDGVDNMKAINHFADNHQLDVSNPAKHMVYFNNTLEILSDLDNESKFVYHQFFLNEIKEIQNSDQKIHYGMTEELSTIPVFYIIKESSSMQTIYWITFMQDDFSYGLVDNIQRELINVLYIVILIVALLLIYWMTSIMRPLKIFVSFIQNLNNEEVKKISMKRKDEIGEVAKALLEREQQIRTQRHLQENFIHNVSHDLKTPITVIKSYAESMKDDIYPYGTKESSLDIIVENADRLEKKVKDFLLIHRLDFLKKELQTPKQSNIYPIVTSILKDFMPLYPNIEFICDLNETSFNGDEEHWRSCITNILENAVRYSEGVIRITLKQDELTIYNNGKAIDEKMMTDIFKPYTKGENGNFGLGMAIASRIVNMYGYNIAAQNIDEGVQFKINKNS